MEFYQKRFITMLYLLLIVATLYGTLFLFNHIHILSKNNQLLAFLFCILLLLFLSYALIKVLLNICKPKLMLKITDDGFEHPGIGFIKWTTITDLYVLQISCSKFINYKVNNYSEVVSKWSFFKKLFCISYDKSFSISLSGTGKNVIQIFQIMHNYWLNNKRKESDDS